MTRAPLLERVPFAAAAQALGIALVGIAPPNADAARLAAIARTSQGYVYVTSRPGVTGADQQLHDGSAGLIRQLRALGAAPPMLGFGIGTPAQVREAIALGAAGAIAGSAVVRRVEQHPPGPALVAAVERFVADMKAATRG